MKFQRGDRVEVTVTGVVIEAYEHDGIEQVIADIPWMLAPLSFLATHVRHADEQPEAPVIEG